MMSQHDEHLDPTTWQDRVRRLVDGMQTAEGSPERAIRQAYHLVRLAPAPLSQAFPHAIEEDALEAMLANEQYEAAALSVVGPEFAATEVHGPSGDRSVPILAAWADSVLKLNAQPA